MRLVTQAQQIGAQLGDPRGQRAHRGAAGLQRGGELDEAQLGEGAGCVVGVEQGAGGVGGGAGAALGGG
ncbi:hypothetical protein ABZW47_32440 [Streptomyces sp. NPDC004549]|uniref:hypothetical protein n=1 Tax=Streptomyces sp. NPDC004549 TaxID=3154283 RepID=UPI0033B0B332